MEEEKEMKLQEHIKEYGVGGYGVAFRLERDDPIKPEELGKMAGELMDEITQECIKRGARYIGHIKSHIKTDDGSVIADVSELETLFGDDIDFMETAGGEGEVGSNS